MVDGWHGWFGTITGVVLVTAVALPLAGVAVWVVKRLRGGSWRTAVAEVGIVYGTVPWVWMILLPNRGGDPDRARVNLVPLRDLVAVVGNGPLSATVQIVGNLLVFAALGFFGPVRFPALALVPRVLGLAAGLSVLVETLQYVLALGRFSSVDDVLLNAAGAGLAALLSRRWWRTAARAGRPGGGSRGEPEPRPGGTFVR
ncbi:VanZ family protein [Dactylosporangium matsuzakiense]|uniref:VanZ-like domain-containing protein n=1 Tax=Dactylosporangium matsuzakiense TaxID=53360 RepID=A0A9W6KIG1_9ACTN|nr:VanZ family protein [Dactylosporangium matsuzakiense]UWZ48798.1 VanZ family protein [Dactylosporangium matsuzakiense]GLL01099.1 hypothetical protein GCM10017581_028400 [Dactylosporangium matsuzakiense]